MAVTFRDSDGTTRLAGDLLASGGATGDVLTQQADGTYAPAAGGSQPETEHLFGNNVNIADAAFALLTWNGSNGPDTLLDRSSTTEPTVITAGWYVVTVPVQSSVLTAGGTAIVSVILDPDDDGWTSNDAIVSPGVNAFAAISGYLDAGDKIIVRVTNNDGAAARNFAISEVAVLKIA